MRPYQGIIKGKGFNPFAGAHIPDFADSSANKKVLGTAAHEDWWNEQFDRCVNGYTTGGIFIPGRYYYYLNFCTISTIGRQRHHPDFVDLDLEFFRLVDEAKQTNKGIIVPKARRRGISEKMVNVIGHGMRFTAEEYRAGVCAGVEKYVESFYKKLKADNSTKEPELRLQFLAQGEELKAGWMEQTTSGWTEAGSKNLVIFRTMFSSGNVFKGEMLNDCFFEEAGEFKKLIEGYGATQDCFAVGPKMVGTPYIGGCVCAGTKVWDNSGNLINIEDLKPENGILGYNGKGVSKETITYWQPPKEKECYRITTKKGRILECSEDHPILWSKNGFSYRQRIKVVGKNDLRPSIKSAKFVEAKDIKAGDQIAVIESVPVYGKKKMWEPRLMGWLIGDGTYGHDHSPRLFNCDNEITTHVLKKFDAKTTRSHITKDGKLYEEIRLKGICHQLRGIGIYGQTKLNKRLPVDIHSYRKKDICELLGGFFDTDGHVNHKGNRQQTITLTASSYDLLFEVKLLLQKIGVHCNISKVKARVGQGRKDKNDYYTINISDVKSIFCFRENISFAVKYKQERLSVICEALKSKVPRISVHERTGGLRFETVSEVVAIGKKPVYNLTAGTTNTYIANGIVTHNTGGAMQTSSKDFAEMWSEAESYNLLKFDILAPRLMVGYFVGSKNEKGELEEHCPNVFEKYRDYSKEQILGIEDVEESTRVIISTRKQLQTLKNRKKYWDYVQNNPLIIGDVFLKFSGNDFDPEALAEQQMYLDTLQTPKYSKFILEWKKNADGTFKQPLEVEFIPATIEAPDELCVLVHNKGMPDTIKNYRNLVLQGIDSYDQDKSDTSNSLGASIVGLRKGNPINPLCRVPIAVYCERPRRKEIFWDIALKMSVAWNTAPHNTMIDAAKPGIIKHYKDNACRRYLAYRPLSFESDKSEQMHEFGVLFTTSSKSLPQMISIAQSWVLDEVHECVFPVMIHHFTHYDTTVTDSDNDTADAWFCWLARDTDMKRQATTGEEEEVDPMQLGYYEEVNGELVFIDQKYVDLKEKERAKMEDGSDKPEPDLFIQMMQQGKFG